MISDLIEFAIEPLPVSLFSQAMKYLAEQNQVVLDSLSQLKLEKEMDFSKAHYINFNYEDYVNNKDKEPGYFEYFDVLKQR